MERREERKGGLGEVEDTETDIEEVEGEARGAGVKAVGELAF
jgi:hypothetical protein